MKQSRTASDYPIILPLWAITLALIYGAGPFITSAGYRPARRLSAHTRAHVSMLYTRKEAQGMDFLRAAS